MQTMRESANATPNFAYWGESDDWLVAYGIHRDSSALERSNFEAVRRMADAGQLSQTDEDEYDPKYRIETASHWAVGHTETLLINPHLDTDTLTKIDAAIIHARDEYPSIDDELYSEIEWSDACSTAESALYELGVPLEERRDAASYVVSWGCDNGGREDYQYSGAENYWPSKIAQFWGYLAYRRSLRNSQLV